MKWMGEEKKLLDPGPGWRENKEEMLEIINSYDKKWRYSEIEIIVYKILSHYPGGILIDPP